MTNNTPVYPEHEKLHERKDEHQMLCDFLEWLDNHDKFALAELFDRGEEYIERYTWAPHPGMERVIAEYFGIDRQKFSEEKDAILRDFLAAQNGSSSDEQSAENR